MRTFGRVQCCLFILSLVITLFATGPPAHSENGINREELVEPYRRAQQTVENILNWNPENPIKFSTQSRKEFEAYVKQNFRRIFSPQKLKELQTKLYLLGFLPEGYSLQNDLTRLYRDQAGAYYHPEREMIYVIPGNLPRKSLYFVMVHELVHAYQDRKLKMGKIRDEYQNRETSFDRKLVFGFLIEGHANLVSVAALLPGNKLNDRFFKQPAFRTVINMMAQFSRVSPSELRSLGQLLGGGLRSNFRNQLDKLKDTPHFLIQTLMDPYLLGQKIWYDRAGEIGWAEAEKWFSNPPTSTYEFLYPTNQRPTQSRNPLRLGGYILLRWTNQLDNRPNWGQSITGDTAELRTHNNNDYLKWTISFESDDSRTQFLKDLRPLTSSEDVPEGILKFDNSYTDSSRYLRLCGKNQKSILLVDATKNFKKSCN